MEDKKDVGPSAGNSYNDGAAFETQSPLSRNYADQFLLFDHGKGVWLWDAAGNKYLDFGSGIAVNSFGHGRPDFAKVVAGQMKKVVHVSNLYSTVQTMDLARRLVAASPLSKDQPYRAVDPAEWQKGVRGPYFKAVHLGNSGTEANEGALKYARIFQKRRAASGGAPNGTRFLAFESAFHGRTMGALSVTHSKIYREINEPLIPGVEFLPFNDIETLRKTLTRDFAAVIVEPIQGEGGLTPMTPEFATALNKLCRELDVVLIADEIQTGCGRTGALFASQHFGLEPDIVTMAKPIAGGLPLSATLLVAKIADAIQPGDHGTTFGGNPVACALGSHVWDLITAPSFLPMVQEKAAWLETGLLRLKRKHKWLGQLKGVGMLRGVEVNLPAPGKRKFEPADATFMPKLIEACRQQGLIVLRSGKNVLRLAPPLTMTKSEMAKGFKLLDAALGTLE
jgi:acetylornithine/N-succinyldiaminopimelate aminotransferase